MQRRVLNEGQKFINQNELAKIAGVFLSLYPDEKSQKKIRYLHDLCLNEINQEGIILTIHEGKDRLKARWFHPALEDEDDGRIRSALQYWIDDYQQLESQTDRSYEDQPLGINGYLGANDRDRAFNAWGDGIDFLLLFKGLMIPPENAIVSKDNSDPAFFVLTPVSLVPSGESKQEKKAGYQFFKNHIETVLRNNPNAPEIHLLIPVNDGRMHWMAAEVILKNGRITEAKLHDNKMPEREPFGNFCSAIRELDSSTVSRGITFAKPGHGRLCLDNAGQKILELLPNSIVRQQGLMNVKNANSPEARRQAVIAKIQSELPPPALNYNIHTSQNLSWQREKRTEHRQDDRQPENRPQQNIKKKRLHRKPDTEIERQHRKPDTEIERQHRNLRVDNQEPAANILSQMKNKEKNQVKAVLATPQAQELLKTKWTEQSKANIETKLQNLLGPKVGPMDPPVDDAIKTVQIKFDEVLASNIQKNLNRDPRRWNDPNLFNDSFRETFIAFQNCGGFFKPESNKRSIEGPPENNQQQPHKKRK